MISNRRAFGDAEWAGLGHVAEDFLEDLIADYTKHGKAFVNQLRIDHPQTYIKVLLLLSPLGASMMLDAIRSMTPEARGVFYERWLEARLEKQAAAPPAAEP